MTYRFVTNVDQKRFDAFCAQCEWNHWSKSSQFIEFSKPEWKGELVGAEDESGNLAATAVLLQKNLKFPPMHFSYCQYGFNLDINNRELLAFFIKALSDYARKNGSCFLRVDPNITRLEHEKNGKVKEGGFNHEFVTEELKQAGYTHLGYNYGYSGNWMSRYTNILDLNRPLKEVRKGIKRCSQYHSKNVMRGVTVEKAGREKLSVLYDAQLELSARLGFKPKPLSYFEKMYDLYKPFVHYYVVSVNFHQAKLNLQKEIQNLQSHQAQCKDEKKIQLDQKQIDAIHKEICQIEDKGYDKDEKMYLGGKFIIQEGANVWNVNMYTKKTLTNFREAFELHYFAIEDLMNNGAKTYNFEGISGSTDPHDYYYSLDTFKKEFGGDFIEYLGEFDAVYKPSLYSLWRHTSRFYSLARRKIRSIIYRR